MTDALPEGAYRPGRPSTSRWLEIRGLPCHFRVWGGPEGRPVVLLHGGQDASATFQFLVDALPDGGLYLAPDWRGHGRSGWAPGGYWFQDYLADLDAILAQVSPDRPATLVGHSLGGNVACIYAGVRPERVSRLVSLDGFGLPDRDPAEAPAHLRRWLDAARTPRAGRVYPSRAEMAERLRQANPRLPVDKALFLAFETSRPEDGGHTWSFDPRHRLPFATLHRAAEWEACLKAVRAPTLWIGSGGVFPPALARIPGEFERRLGLISGAGFVRLDGTGHNLHHDAPEALAAVLARFLGVPDGDGRTR